jgi:hypothetical protein
MKIQKSNYKRKESRHKVVGFHTNILEFGALVHEQCISDLLHKVIWTARFTEFKLQSFTLEGGPSGLKEGHAPGLSIRRCHVGIHWIDG